MHPLNDTPAAQSPFVTAYLFTYNTLSCLAWLYVLITTLRFIVTGPYIAPPIASTNATATLSATSQARAFLAGLGTRFFGFPPVHSSPAKPLVNVATGAASKLHLWPEALASYLGGSYAYKGLGPAVVWTQTPALLEVVHAVTGLVKSSPVTVAMQVASRVWMVWGVVEQRPEVSATSDQRQRDATEGSEIPRATAGSENTSAAGQETLERAVGRARIPRAEEQSDDGERELSSGARPERCRRREYRRRRQGPAGCRRTVEHRCILKQSKNSAPEDVEDVICR